MQLDIIPLARLSIAAVNMRDGRKPPAIDDILPSIRARGVLVPLIVRPVADTQDAFEIVAGRRRFHAAWTIAAETGEDSALPCAIIAAGDDAAALEASLLENFARENPHESELWASFTKLVRQGRSAGEIAATFGFSERQIGQILALGNLLPRIRDLYRAERIDVASIRLLTMATKAQQRDWLAIFADPERRTPTGQQLRHWLFGGQAISTAHALFDLASYQGQIVSDLFGSDGWFADSGQFWEAQRAAIETRRQAYLAEGWREVVLFEPGTYFSSYEYQRTPKRKGGRVYVVLSPRGEVVFHEGYLPAKEARKQASGGEEAAPKPVRAEVSSALGNYVDLHRHAAVRAALLDRPAMALRLVLAYALAATPLFRVTADPEAAATDAIRASVAASAASATLALRRRAARVLLGLEESELAIAGAGEDETSAIFVRLLALDDAVILGALAVVMADSLAAGSAIVEALGHPLGIDMTTLFKPDDCLLDLLRDREVVTAMVAEVAGEDVASANARATIAVQRGVLRDCLAGTGGRTKVEGWVPRWLAMPPASYTERGGVRAVRNWQRVASLFDTQAGAGDDTDASAGNRRGPAPLHADASRTEREGPTPDAEAEDRNRQGAEPDRIAA
ncbi:ParB/RepB/Spo0J family partition protein [Sphingomonas sp. HF-S4]|uniref:ParB/RepB/Spo0J family partition protein n=1 Tax=Sphingomonas agrestis TaxID=3080540 RepID=A0ABU3Y390_9SPHN|nr:ParB/RepB/Spo0J family partition protein [Sphingomonas sp. HF-S4]MDV3455865.1 ParB/RepB/Spo0J family partition protein [Sphingomonas sp. HF-S4]